MIALAFKDATLAGGFFSKAIAWKTGGKFSHVELWLTGERENALCFSSREPHGTGYAHVNLESPLWTIVPIECTAEQLVSIRAFCEGFNNRRYDWLGILGFVWPWRNANIHDRTMAFCSETVVVILQKCLGLLPKIVPWETSPSDLCRLVTEKELTA